MLSSAICYDILPDSYEQWRLNKTGLKCCPPAVHFICKLPVTTWFSATGALWQRQQLRVHAHHAQELYEVLLLDSKLILPSGGLHVPDIKMTHVP
jgi:hypothetical protein